jgi:hypothetical protein
VTRLRGILVAGQAATIVVTWPLWELRQEPPLLPWLDLACPCGALLLSTLVLAALRPLPGALLHAAALAFAIALDETRAQPAPLSMALLLVASSDARLLPLAPAHLCTQWAWAGTHKLLSPAFFAVVAPAIARALPAWLPGREHAGLLGACVEIALGCLVLVPRARRVAAGVAVVFHLVLAASLALLDINRGVWAWNVVLAGTAWALFGSPANEPAPSTGRVHRRAIAGAWALLAFSPALHYGGAIHPALSHQLYTGGAPTTLTCDREGRACRSDVELRETLDAFGVPIPGRLELLRAYFLATCAPGDRWLARSRTRGPDYGEIALEARCPDPRETSHPSETDALWLERPRAFELSRGPSSPRMGGMWEIP